MSEFPNEKLREIIDCVTDIDDYPAVEKSETNDSDETKSNPKVVLVTGGAGKLFIMRCLNVALLLLYATCRRAQTARRCHPECETS